MYKQQGPYIMQEYDTPTVTQSGDLVSYEMNQIVAFNSDPTNTMEETMWLPNHGAISYWW
jgi:hypothetical protein